MEPAEYALMDEAEGRMWWYRALHRRLLDALAGVQGDILDAGCGTGGFLAMLCDQRPDLIRFGLEWDATAADRAKAKGRAAIVRGRIVLNLPAYQWLMSAHDRQVHNVRRFTARGTAGMLRQAGFGRIRSFYWNGLLLPLMAAQRKILARGDSVSDVAPFPPWLDGSLLAVTKFERHLPVGLPFGGSVLAIAERP
jgi:SAM-dependent methyltransferase